MIQIKAKTTDHLDFTGKLNFKQILTNPILDIGARLWDDERYDAFKTCYRSMRIVDDLIDDRKVDGDKLSEIEKRLLTAKIVDWIEALDRNTPIDLFQKQFLETLARFQIPVWPWRRFAQSMIYDLYYNGFRTFPIFLEYAEGAAVAPGSVFMHLCGIVKENDRYRPPQFDIRKAARPLARFCYLVHIVRDFQKDQNSGLNYFADNLVAENGLNPTILREIANGGEENPTFRKLIQKYYNFAEDYRSKARHMLDEIVAYLEPRYLLSLEVIYSLYLQIFERIDVQNGRFTTIELMPSPEEIKNRIDLTISSFKSTLHESKI
ncbi:MAG: squalene/phytoene synthase family protein [Promethearchaeota archaeon]